ncbi:hypothetical protein ACFXPS_38550 [Nocardia sp. NPDC059091]|uniref:hypothetical protein n=1 Tax=unclassified Nocardia TaxID=2637762 RepID=UPI0036BEE832
MRSVLRWRRDFEAGGVASLRSKGPPSLPLPSNDQFAVLEQELAEGALAQGWPDQRWTLSWIATVIGRRPGE